MLGILFTMLLDPVGWIALAVGWGMRKNKPLAACAGAVYGLALGGLVVGMGYLTLESYSTAFWVEKAVACALLALIGAWFGARRDRKKEEREAAQRNADSAA